MSDELFRLAKWSEVKQDDVVFWDGIPSRVRVARFSRNNVGEIVLSPVDQQIPRRAMVVPGSSRTMIQVPRVPADGLCHNQQISGDCSLKLNHPGFCDWEGR